ncbi:uroporphyrinogen decarboxylase family protein [Bacillota bacterium LX-D]|nr:uroporphyrinogen decarboxylase family protein [Bacillota bacterium LX-D]
MNHIERVLMAIAHQEPDRVPRGEFWLEQGLVKKLVSDIEDIGDFKAEVQALNALKFDLRAISPKEPPATEDFSGKEPLYKDMWGRKYTKLKELKVFNEPPIKDLALAEDYLFPNAKDCDYTKITKWREKTDFFLFALVDGVFEGVSSLLDFNQFLMATVNNTKIIQKMAAERARYLYEQVQLSLAAGADGILIGDDIAFNGGTLISPEALRKIFFPVYFEVVNELRQKGIPVFLHSDGNLNQILGDLVEIGFHGLHSLEPGAGMEIGAIKKEFGHKLCLMGNLDLGLLAMGSVSEVQEAAKNILNAAASGGGFIFSSAAGILSQDIPIENLQSVTKVLEQYNSCKQ